MVTMSTRGVFPQPLRDSSEKLVLLLLALSAPLMHRPALKAQSMLRSPSMADAVMFEARALSTNTMTPETISNFVDSQGIPKIFEFSNPGSFTMEVSQWSLNDQKLSNVSRSQPCFGYVFSGKVQMVKKDCEDCTFLASQGNEFYLREPSQWIVRNSNGNGVLLHLRESKELALGDHQGEDHFLFPGRNPPTNAADASALIVGDKMQLSSIGPILELATFYPGAKQSFHTHPTGRIVVMLSGRGRLEWFDSSQNKVKAMIVRQGMAFGWEPDVPHAFSVDESCDAPLEIFAFQTDGDTFNYPWPEVSE